MKSILHILSAILAVSALAALTGCITPARDAVPVTALTIDPVTHAVVLSNPKDTTIKNFAAHVSTNGSFVTFDSLTTVMNPDVITTTGEAQAKMISATGDAVTKALTGAAAAAVAAKP